MQKLIRTLRFLRITDEKDNLSITNIAIVVTLVALVNRPELSLQDVLTFFATVIGYHVKRFAKSPTSPAADTEDLQRAIDSLETKVAALHLGKSIRNDR